MATATRNKEALKAELVAILSRALETAEAAQRAIREGATHEEAKPENDKDTRALEQSYLAHGQAKRLEELRTEAGDAIAMPLRAFREGERISLGALVGLEEHGAVRFVFVAPSGGGESLDEGRVQVVSLKSPLGRAIVGKVVGDEIDVVLGGRARSIAIESVA